MQNGPERREEETFNKTSLVPKELASRQRAMGILAGVWGGGSYRVWGDGLHGLEEVCVYDTRGRVRDKD